MCAALSSAAPPFKPTSWHSAASRGRCSCACWLASSGSSSHRCPMPLAQSDLIMLFPYVTFSPVRQGHFSVSLPVSYISFCFSVFLFPSLPKHENNSHDREQKTPLTQHLLLPPALLHPCLPHPSFCTPFLPEMPCLSCLSVAHPSREIGTVTSFKPFLVLRHCSLSSSAHTVLCSTPCLPFVAL